MGLRINHNNNNTVIIC